jgi:GxxExxY protein
VLAIDPHHVNMPESDLLQEKLTHSILGGFFEVYNGLGDGYLEHLYLAALELELIERGHRVAREFGVRVFYKGQEIGFQRLDMVIDDTVVIEAKSTAELHKNATRQVYNYLRATNLEVGLLLHFGREPRFFRIVCENRLKQHTARSVASVPSVRSASPSTEGPL